MYTSMVFSLYSFGYVKGECYSLVRCPQSPFFFLHFSVWVFIDKLFVIFELVWSHLIFYGICFFLFMLFINVWSERNLISIDVLVWEFNVLFIGNLPIFSFTFIKSSKIEIFFFLHFDSIHFFLLSFNRLIPKKIKQRMCFYHFRLYLTQLSTMTI